MRYFLGIESSCDDTSVALVGMEGTIAANVVSSQVKVHAPYGGVVPELASREHIVNFPVVYEEAMSEAGISPNQIEAVAATQGPGLMGCLMVGFNFAKGLAMSWGKPLIPVDHIRAHVAAAFLQGEQVPLPGLALIVSGGHTHLFRVERDRRLVLLTKTRDDAAGEAFDKLSKMLGLGFPGGAIVDGIAELGDPKAYSLPQPKFRDGSKDFSFSGLKTSALRTIEAAPKDFRDSNGDAVRGLCASYRAAIVRQLLNRMTLAHERYRDLKSVMLGGGVACNRLLRRQVQSWADQRRLFAVISPPKLCTDNAAMIAWEGIRQWELSRGDVRNGYDLGPDITLEAFDSVALL